MLVMCYSKCSLIYFANAQLAADYLLCEKCLFLETFLKDLLAGKQGERVIHNCPHEGNLGGLWESDLGQILNTERPTK